MKGKILVGLQFFFLGALFVSSGTNDRALLTSITSGLLLTCSLLLLFRGFKDLGDALTPLPESKSGASLVTDGIYSHIRHPIYSALFLLTASVILWKQSAISVFLSVLLIGLLIYKSKYEDSLLRKKFSEAAKYQHLTPAFLPRIRNKDR
jgi:protein-S-isoprenylcysteine O-methyltransferase Ste14